MGDNENIVKSTAETVKSVMDAVPIYPDLIQPAAKELGKGLETIAKTVHIALAPISALVWGYKEICAFLEATVTEKLKRVPPENIISPNPTIAVPAIEALRYSANEEHLRELYASLLATSMDKETAKKAHPAYVEVIKQLSPDEAKILRILDYGSYPLVSIYMNADALRSFIEEKALENDLASTKGPSLLVMRHITTLGIDAKCAHKELTSTYIDNLSRLGLIEVHTDRQVVAPGAYDAIFNIPKLKSFFTKGGDRNDVAYASRYMMNITDFGAQFAEACVLDGRHPAKKLLIAMGDDEPLNYSIYKA